MNIQLIDRDKKRFLPLLLEADEQESMIDRYLSRGELFVLFDEKEETVKMENKDPENKEEQKKARTHRLCQIGGAVESVLGGPIEEADIPKLIGFLKRQEENGFYFSRAMGREPKEKKSTEAIRQEDF